MMVHLTSKDSPYFIFSLLVHASLLFGFYFSTAKTISISQVNKALSRPFTIQADISLEEPREVAVEKVIKKITESPSDFTKAIEKPVEQKTVKVQKKSETKSYTVDFTQTQQKAPKELRAFFKALVKEIHQKTKYPRLSRKLRETGLVHVKFTITKNGEILSSSLKKPCDYKRLNSSALEVVSRLELTELPPENYPKINVTFPLSYNL